MDGMLCLIFFLHGVAFATSSVSNLVVNNTSGFFWSDNFPDSYYDSTADYWYLTTQNASHHVNIYFVDSTIESSADCAYDYVKVYDGATTSSHLMKKFCGTTRPCLTSSGNTMTVYFSTDSSISNRGFRVKYWSSEPGRHDCVFPQSLGTAIIVAIIIGAMVLLVVLTVIIFVVIKGSTKKPIRPHGRPFNTSAQPPMPPPYMFVNPANRGPTTNYQQYPTPGQDMTFYAKTQTVQGPPGQQGMYSWTDNAPTNGGNHQNVQGPEVPGPSQSVDYPGHLPNEPPPAYDSLSPPPPANYVNPPPQNFG